MPLSAKTLLLAILGFITFVYVIYWITVLRRTPVSSGESRSVRPVHLAIGFVTCFFDTLGISSFATTTSLFKFARLVPDRVIPGTLNVGHLLPTVIQAFIYIRLVEVDPQTLVLLIAASVAGAWLGAGIVAGLSKLRVQVGMGIALLIAACMMLMSQLKLTPGGGAALEIDGLRLTIGIAGNFVLGALMTLGIGLYAPCLIMISLLGMNPSAAFPIMMGSCAFLMPASGVRFIRSGSYDAASAIGLSLGGIPAVLLAAFLVRSLPLDAVRWLVVVVVVYTGITMLRAASDTSRSA